MKYSIGIGTLLAVCVIGFASGCDSRPEKTADYALSKARIKVQVAQPEVRRFKHLLRVQGTTAAVEHAAISARLVGTLDSVYVDEGDRVKKGDLLFQVDRLNLENAVEVAQADLNVAEDTLKSAEADLGIYRVLYEKAIADLRRSKELLTSDATSVDADERAEVAVKAAASAVRKHLAVVRLNRTRVDQKKVLLDIARKNRDDSRVTAPFDGVVTRRKMEPKEFAGVGREVLSLENQSALEVSALLSGVYYTWVPPGIEAKIYMDGRFVVSAPVTYRAPAVEPLSRTFEIKVKLPENTPIPTGMLCDVELVLAGRDAPGLPSDAVMARKNGRFVVYVAENGRAESVEVQPGITMENRTEIRNPEVLEKRPVIVNGHYFVNDGALLEILSDSPAETKR